MDAKQIQALGGSLQGMGAWFAGQGPQYQIAENDRLETLEKLDEKRQKAMMMDMRGMRMMLEQQDFGGAQSLAQSRLEAINQLGGDPSHTAEVLRLMQEGNYEEAYSRLKRAEDIAVGGGILDPIAGPEVKIQGGQAFRTDPITGKVTAEAIEGFDPALAGTAGSGRPIIQNGQVIVPDGKGGYMAQPVQGFIAPPTPEGPTMYSATTKVFLNGTTLQTDRNGGRAVTTPDGRNVSGAEAEAVLKKALEDEVGFAGDKSLATGEGKATGTGNVERRQVWVDEGYTAAKAMPVLNRTLELLNLVDTGGLDEAKLKAKQFFGVEGANEAELTTNLARSVLAQLKPTFGSAFTQKEGAEMKIIEAGIGKSTKGNIRIINQLLKMTGRYAETGIKAAEALGDYDAANNIRGLMDMRYDSSAYEAPAGGGDIPSVPTAPSGAPAGVKILEDANGNRAYQYPDGRIEEIN